MSPFQEAMNDLVREYNAIQRGDFGPCPECGKTMDIDDIHNQIDAGSQTQAEWCVECWSKTLKGTSMYCAGCKCDGKQVVATRRLWCPTWVSANKGPHEFCDECAKKFQSNDGGSWHWEEEADAAFRMVERFIMPSDPTHDNVVGMLDNFPPIKETQGSITPVFTYIVDGKAWIKHHAIGIPGFYMLCLGDHFAARQKFPLYFN